MKSKRPLVLFLVSIHLIIPDAHARKAVLPVVPKSYPACDPIPEGVVKEFCKFKSDHFEYCLDAGASGDKRGVNRQYFCDELPLGTTALGASPAGYNTYYSRAAAIDYSQPKNWRPIVSCTAMGSCENSIARKKADDALALWKSKKVVFRSQYDFRDSYSTKTIPIELWMDRAPSNTRVSISNGAGGFRNDKVDITHQFLGYYSANFTNTAKTELEICSYFPGQIFPGNAVSSEYVKRTPRPFKDIKVGISFNPGSFSYSSIEFCFLTSIVQNADGTTSVKFLGSKAPTFANALYSGINLRISVSGIGALGSLLSSVVNLVADFKIMKIEHGLAEALESNDMLSDSYKQAFGSASPKFDTSAKNVKSGAYLRDSMKAALLSDNIVPGAMTAVWRVEQAFKEKGTSIDAAQIESFLNQYFAK